MRALRLPVRIRRYYFVSQPVDAPRLPDRWRKRFDVRILTAPAAELSDLPLSRDVIRFRFKQRAFCFFAKKKGQTAGCLWMCPDDYTEDEVAAVYRPTPVEATVWDFDVYVSPQHRGSFIFSALWDAANTWLRDQGVRWSVSRISAYNLRSLAAHERLGARVVGAATFIRCGHAQLCLSTLQPRVHVCLTPGGAPLIHVPAEPGTERGKGSASESVA
jgi:GNAT superfamily N-acetyltransferase